MFWAQVEKTETCWVWKGHTHKGYGRYSGRGAHRVAYEEKTGQSIPNGMELDHTCRNPLCVRPSHLEPVTRAENMRRRYALITECVNGHQFDEANTYIWRGHRACRACRTAAASRYKERKVA